MSKVASALQVNGRSIASWMSWQPCGRDGAASFEHVDEVLLGENLFLPPSLHRERRGDAVVMLMRYATFPASPQERAQPRLGEAGGRRP